MNVLAGKRIVVTRAPEQAAGLRSALEAEGARVVLCPTIRICPPESPASLDAALRSLSEYSWIVFTSANGVRFTMARLMEIVGDVAPLRWMRIATLGLETERALLERGISSTFTGSGDGAAGLANALPAVTGARILLSRSSLADPSPAEILRRRGADRVDEVVAYRVAPCPPDPPALAELEQGVHAITFTSPSTVDGLESAGPRYLAPLRGSLVATIGPTTTAAARAAGWPRIVEARTPDAASLVAALSEGLSSRGAPDT